MKFECDSCSANYKIADEKVSGKGVKVKCKRCGHVIIVRPPTDDVAANDAAAASEEDDGFGETAVDHADGVIAGVVATPPEAAAGFDDGDLTAGDGALFTDSRGDDGVFGDMTQAQPEVAAAMEAVAAADGDLSAAASSASERPPWEDDEDASAFADGERTGADLGSPFGDEVDATERENGAAGEKPDAGEPEGDGFSDEPFHPEGFHASERGDTELGVTHNDAEEDPPEPVVEDTQAVPDPGLEALAGFTDEEVAAPVDEDTLLGGAFGSESVGAFAAMPEEPPGPDAALDDVSFGDVPSPDDVSMPVAAAGAGMSLPDPDAAGAADGLDEQLEGAFSTMFGDLPSHSPDAPVPEPTPFNDPFSADAAPNPTALLDMDQMDQLRADSSPTGEGQGLDAVAALSEDSEGWHAAIDDEDHGPMRLSELEGHVRSGAVDPETLVWRTGMADWTAAGDLPDVAPLFSGIPMPSLGGLDVGAPIDDLSPSPFGGPENSDPFGHVPDAPARDPNWQPHGLTEVYAAANLAEAAGGGGGVAVAVGAGLGAALPTPAVDGGGWTPSAASALESLVNDEIARIGDDAPGAPSDALPPAAEGSLLAAAGIGGSTAPAADMGGALSGAFAAAPGTGASQVAGPAIGDGLSGQYPAASGAVPFGAQSQSMGYAPAGGVPYGASASMAYAPPVPPARSPLFYVGVAVGGLFALILLVAVVKLAFFPAQPMVAVAPTAVQPVSAGAEGAAGTPSTSDKGAPADPKADGVAKATGQDGDAAAAPKTDDDTKVAMAAPSDKAAPPADPEVPKDKQAADKEAADDDVKKASTSSKTSSKRSSRRKKETSTKRARPKKSDSTASASASSTKKESTRRRRKSSGGGCDILDPDCDDSGASKRSAKKATLSKADILGVVKKNISRVNRCGKKHGGTGQTVKVKWKVLKSGKTSGVSVSDAKHKSSSLGKCLVSEVKRWRFPEFKSSKSVPVAFPFKLK